MPKTTKKVSAAKTVKQTAKATAKDTPALSEVKQIYKFMQDNNLGTVDYEESGTRIRLVRMPPAQVAVPVAAGASGTLEQEQPSAQPQYSQTIKSPLMGIFFRGSSPSAPPFVKEGEKVKAGTPICLIEAMKVFNEVKASNDCVIKKVLVENGQPVKPGDLLFAIEKI
ncbi:MAG: acetyl-CoA carboxylase biotin carboxyl carrier protein [Elusimicrobiaceae bacterium]|nr:biotin/lipoyl-binding protein [Elusimicrobiota bacterium]